MRLPFSLHVALLAAMAGGMSVAPAQARGEQKIAYVDLLEAHRRDFASFRVSPTEYTTRYYVQGPDTAAITLRPFMGGSSSKSSHYNPMGNEFEAFAILPRLVGLLNPKPPAYR